MAKRTNAKKRGKKLTISVLSEAATAFKEFGKITRRKPEEVASDAFRVYMWVLFEQTFGGVVNARHSKSEENRDLENLVKDKKAAQKYLGPYRHLMRRNQTSVSIQQG